MDGILGLKIELPIGWLVGLSKSGAPRQQFSVNPFSPPKSFADIEKTTVVVHFRVGRIILETGKLHECKVLFFVGTQKYAQKRFK